MDAVTYARKATPGRVLFVTSSFPRWPGDSATPFVLHLAQDLQDLGWSVHVLAPHAEGAERKAMLDGVSVERFRYWWPDSAQSVCYNGGALLNLRTKPGNFAKLPALIASELAASLRCLAGRRFSIVHSHWLLPQGFVAGLAATANATPHVTTVHGGDIFALRGRVLRTFKQAALRRSDAVTVNSSATEAAIRAIDACEGRLYRIPMGATVPAVVDPNRVSKLRDQYRRKDGPLLVFVGRLIEEKGVGDILLAVATLVADLPNVSVVIVGDGPDRLRFQDLAKTLGVADRVQFTGWIDSNEVSDYVRSADVFVGPSKRSPDGWVEAQGLVFVEAMLAGVPVIACATGGVADVVRHEDTGLLVPESAPGEIARAVLRLQDNPVLRERLVNAASAHAGRKFTRQACAGHFSELYLRVLEARRSDVR